MKFLNENITEINNNDLYYFFKPFQKISVVAMHFFGHDSLALLTSLQPRQKHVYDL